MRNLLSSLAARFHRAMETSRDETAYENLKGIKNLSVIRNPDGSWDFYCGLCSQYWEVPAGLLESTYALPIAMHFQPSHMEQIA